MKKVVTLMLVCIIGVFSVSFTGCGPGKAGDARDNPDAAKEMEKESKAKLEKGGQ